MSEFNYLIPSRSKTMHTARTAAEEGVFRPSDAGVLASPVS